MIINFIPLLTNNQLFSNILITNQIQTQTQTGISISNPNPNCTLSPNTHPITMITQSIRTSKYTTTIDIPAQKLQTRAKFIQISKSPTPLRQQTITIPNTCYQTHQQNRKSTLQTRVMIEELQQAYNEDVQKLEEQIRQLKMDKDLDRLKAENSVEYQKREVEILKKNYQQAQEELRRSRQQQDSNLSRLSIEVNQKDQILSTKSEELVKVQSQLQSLRKQLQQKNTLLMSKFKEFQTDKDRKFTQQRRTFETKFQAQRRESSQLKRELQRQLQRLREDNKRQSASIERLQRENHSFKQQQIENRKQIDFQTNEINTYIKNLKQLEDQKQLLQQNNENLHDKIEEQNGQIEKLLEEMKEQRIYMDTHVIEANPIRDDGYLTEIKLLRGKLDEYSFVIQQKDKLVTQKEAQYLLKLKEIDEEKVNTKKVQEQLSNTQQQLLSLKTQISQLTLSNQHLKTQLATKIVQYNQLLTKPPEHFQVKIQKTIDRKDYIQSLQLKIHQLEQIVEHLREDNSSYIDEIRKKVKEEQNFKVKEQKLLKSNEELKEYISSRERSIGWAVEREIMKDVEISQQHNSSSQKQHSGYKVFVRASNSSGIRSEGSQIEVSGIQPGGANKDINFSVSSKIEDILQKKQLRSDIQVNSGQQYEAGNYKIGGEKAVKRLKKYQQEGGRMRDVPNDSDEEVDVSNNKDKSS